MDLLSFFFEDHRCPHCGVSLRLRWVKTVDMPGARWSDTITSHEVCPACHGAIILEDHPAVIDDWLWAKRLAPGLAVWLIAILAGFPPLLMMTGTVMMVIGLILVVHYMVRERLGRPRFRKFIAPGSEQ